MPEEVIAAPPAPAPAAPAPVAPPSSAVIGTPVPESSEGSASLIDEMDAFFTKGAEPAKPAERERGPDGKFLTKPEDKKEPEKKPEPVKPAEQPKPADEKHGKDPVALRKRLAELEGQLKQTQAEKQTELEKLTSKISEFEKRKFVTPEQEAMNKRHEERARKLEADLAAKDYRSSDAFKNEFTVPWQDEYRNGVADVVQLTITNAETNETRSATQADFDTVRMAGTFVQQRNAAKALFGENWDVVMTHVNNMRTLEDRAAKAVAQKQQNFESEQQQHSAEYQTHYDETTSHLISKYPDYFGDVPEAPELSVEMKKGLDFIDRALEKAQTSTPKEQAIAAATIRLWAGSFMRGKLASDKKDAEIASLKEQLAKYQTTDPGAGGDGAAPAGGTDSGDSGGVDALAAEFEKIGG